MREQQDPNPKKPLTAAERQRRLRQRRRLDNLCTRCGQHPPCFRGGSVCYGCLEAIQQRQAELAVQRQAAKAAAEKAAANAERRAARAQRKAAKEAEAAEQLAAQLAEMGFDLGHAYGFGWVTTDGTITEKALLKIFDITDGRCAFCGRYCGWLKAMTPTLETPTSKGGLYTIDNVLLSCSICRPYPALGVDAKIFPVRQK